MHNTPNSILDLISKNRENNCKFHKDLAHEWLIIGEIDKLQTPLTYSSFEYRLAIERFLFEFLILIKKEEGITSKDENKTANITSLIKYIYSLAGGKKYYPKILRFNRIILSFDYPIKLAEPNLETFFKKWKELSKFCHLLIRPDLSWRNNDDFVQKGYILLNETKDLIYMNTVENALGWYPVSTIPNKEVIELRDDFINDRIDEASLINRFNLMKPILELRRKRRI